jgi:hypothetical protein
VDSAPVVWISPAGTDRPASADRALDAWGRSHGLHLVAPKVEAAHSIPVDLGLADSVEEDLERARDAMSALDVEGSERALARAEVTLREHPELPQAAWLMAEVERGWARRWTSVPPAQSERAAQAWALAESLDGGREPGLGEVAAKTTTAPISFQLAIQGGGDARLDGKEVESGTLTALPGPHQLTLNQGGVLVWASWVGLGDGVRVEVRAPRSPPCSTEDLGRVQSVGGLVRAAGVTCDLWVAAEPERTKPAILVSLCRADHCSDFVEYRMEGAIVAPPAGVRTSSWPAWATWTLLGAGAAAAGGLTLGIDVAFHSSTSTSPFSVGGCSGCAGGVKETSAPAPSKGSFVPIARRPGRP